LGNELLKVPCLRCAGHALDGFALSREQAQEALLDIISSGQQWVKNVAKMMMDGAQQSSMQEDIQTCTTGKGASECGAKQGNSGRLDEISTEGYISESGDEDGSVHSEPEVPLSHISGMLNLKQKCVFELHAHIARQLTA
jgi:hypothetical protein